MRVTGQEREKTESCYIRSMTTEEPQNTTICNALSRYIRPYTVACSDATDNMTALIMDTSHQRNRSQHTKIIHSVNVICMYTLYIVNTTYICFTLYSINVSYTVYGEHYILRYTLCRVIAYMHGVKYYVQVCMYVCMHSIFNTLT